MSRRIVFIVLVTMTLLLAVDALMWPGISHLLEAYDASATTNSAVFWSFWGLAIFNVVLLTGSLLQRRMFADRSSYRKAFSIFGWTIFYLVPRLLFLVAALIYAIASTIVGWTGSMHDPIYLLWLAVGIWVFLTLSIAHGIIRGRFAWKVIDSTLEFDNLPPAFDGLRIMQISDIHIGSFFTNHKPVQQVVARMNALKPDLILFTGDLVNNYATETDGWAEIFNQLEAPMGIYSVLGNHDYGEYVKWDSENELKQNMEHLEQAHRDFGFKLMRNDMVRFERGQESIVLAGVENWGLPPFPQYGDLKGTLENTTTEDFKVLMSHDPSHWDAQVVPESDVDLTLSGHTHGMQFGIEIGNWKWSPVKYRYPRWAGLYQIGKQMLYVNRGFGYIGFPGRVGIRPEITMLELRRKG